MDRVCQNASILVLVNLFNPSHDVSYMTAVWSMTIMKLVRYNVIIKQLHF